MDVKVFTEDGALELAEKLLQNDKDIKEELEEKIADISVGGDTVAEGMLIVTCDAEYDRNANLSSVSNVSETFATIHSAYSNGRDVIIKAKDNDNNERIFTPYGISDDTIGFTCFSMLISSDVGIDVRHMIKYELILISSDDSIMCRAISNILTPYVELDILNAQEDIVNLQSDVDELSNRITTVENDYLKSSDKTELTQAIATAKTETIETILGEAVDADFDTLQEVADWIQADTTASAELVVRVTDAESNIVAIKDDYLKAVDKTELLSSISTNTTAISKNTTDITKNATAIEENTEAIADNTTAIAVERARIDAFVALPEGSTTGDAALEDIKIKVDGTSADTAGNAVREQINTLDDKIDEEVGKLSSEIADISSDNNYTNRSMINGFSGSYNCFPLVYANRYISIPDGTEVESDIRVTFEKPLDVPNDMPVFLEITNPDIKLISCIGYELDSNTCTTIPFSVFEGNIITHPFKFVFGKVDSTALTIKEVQEGVKVYQYSNYCSKVVGKNKFNKEHYYTGYLNNKGKIESSDKYFTTHSIDVRQFENIAINTRFRKFVAYDEYFRLLSDLFIDEWTEPCVIEKGDIGFLQVSCDIGDLDSLQIEDSDTITTYSEHEYMIDEKVNVFTEKNKRKLSEIIGDNLSGKIGISFGDSIMYGAGGGGVGILDILAEKHGVVSNDFSVGGASMQYVSSRPHIVAQIQNALSSITFEPNFILLNGLSNDVATSSSVLGELTDSFDYETKGYATFTDGMEYAIGLLKNAFPSVPIIYVIPHSTPARAYSKELEYGERAREICKKWSVPIADVYRNGNVNTRLQNQLELYSYYPTETSGTHPNRNGYEFAYIPLIEEILKRLF